MRYVGSKRKIAKQILAEITKRRGNRDLYWEPFVGGCNAFSVIAPHFRKAWGSDGHEDLILMWQAVMDGWTPPESVTEDDYVKLRDESSSALRGFVGFGGSFGGKWFGGYARGGFMSNGSPRNHQAESARAVNARRKEIGTADVKFVHRSYNQGHNGSSNLVIYCDPPYASTLGYKGTVDFDHVAFWQWCRDQVSIGSLVLVSEYTAPNDFVCVAEFDHRMSVALTSARKATIERLFVHESQV